MQGKRSMALDVGSRTIGIAVSDPTGLFASGLEVLRRTTQAEDMARLDALVAAYEVGTLVVGYPKNMNGSVGANAAACAVLAAELAQRHPQLQVVLQDERLSTVAAARTLLEADLSRKKRKQLIDKQAAQVILQTYLDGQNYKR